ncbi:hypothetical protein [Pyrococcus abyssi]|uniref:hypothetical protein n=1 Tax=Pyrococcus abyssi TaxID=29292 RepID=UPI000A84563D|nr:hypothetical protein [Pyrococcus abyssi]
MGTQTKRKKDISRVLEEIISEEFLLDLESSLEDMLRKFDETMEFEPVSSRGTVSDLVREMKANEGVGAIMPYKGISRRR